MKTNSISTGLTDLIEAGAAKAPQPKLEDVSFQQVAADMKQEAPAQSPDLPKLPPVLQTPASVATQAAYQPSANPIWDTGWEIQAEDPELGKAAITSLQGLFSKNGVQEGTVKLSYIEELAVCPGVRSWVNKSVVVEYPNGQLEKFSAEWTQKRPEWTLCSMLERMGAEGPVQVVT